jgi:hypothetical protein
VAERGLRNPRARVARDVVAVRVPQQVRVDVSADLCPSTSRRIDCGDDGLDGTSRIST